MPDILSLALFERGDRTLVARRKAGRPPFAGRWLLPGGPVGGDEAAEEVLEDLCHRELGVEIAGAEFVETLYLEDSDERRYVANVFRVSSFEGALRFRSAGDYDDVRWLRDDELAKLPVPAALRDWVLSGRDKAPTAASLPLASDGQPPDNRAGWNTIARAYQDEKELSTERLSYGPRCPGEDELQLLGDLSGQRVIVLGCGGGQECIVLAKRGAQVVGIDLSDKQIEYGRRLAEREAVLVTLLQGNVEELTGIDDGTNDLALSLYALQFVERMDRVFTEVYRVLKPGGALVFSTHHPIDACLEDAPPYAAVKSYWQRQFDWRWDFPKAGVSARLREWHRPVSEWFSLLIDAGFRVERLLEPPPVEGPPSPSDRGNNIERMRLIPRTLIIKAVKPLLRN